MTFQRAHDFEFATLLVSLLLGKGYNAFVVSGYASREQVFCDTRMRTCPYLEEEKTSQADLEPVETPKYKLKSPPDFRSQLLIELEAREAKKVQEELEKLEQERAQMLLEQERPLPDDFWGNRIHAWVLVLPEVGGPRGDEIEKAFFVEPNSGFHYFPDNPETKLLYHGIESLWNDKNYWVNMQTCENGCSDLDWDLSNTDKWERLLPCESGLIPWTNEDEDVDEDVFLQQKKHLEMPLSYVENIEIDSLDFERRYPNGTKTVYFKKTRVDFYAPYVQMDGLVRKITIYEDYEYKFPVQVEEKFSNRADMLIGSKKYSETCAAVDSYKRGRTDACIEHRYLTNGRDRLDEERTLHFFHSIRPDGLSKIEMDPFHLTQHYIGRKDFLYYRHVEYSKDEDGGPHDRIVSRIIEKYNRNDNIPASKDVAIRDFYISKNEIRLHYHYEKNRVTRATKRFIKPSTTESGEHPIFNPDLIYGYNPDPLAAPEKQLSIYYELKKQLKEESECLILVRDAEIEITTFLKKKSSEYIMPKLLVSFFDRNRNEEAKAKMLAQEQLLKAQSEKEVEVEADYLGPYMARLGNPPELTKAQATYVRNECLNDLKKLFVDRANHMLRMMDECTKELNQVQNWLTQSEGKTREEEEELLSLTNDINFRLHTLDVRLQRHCELAPERYRKMLMTLKADERLVAFFD
ncbi:dynein regulatory complex subunit 7-like isoform X2 [Venturia canescens]|nr:dynein regulatory complex subunit 7-like isoform X2 [Venturia canescens]